MSAVSRFALEVVHELVRKAHYCIFPTTKDRVLSEGGLITAAKTYLKSAIVVLEEMPFTTEFKTDHPIVREIMRMLLDLMGKTDKKAYRFDITNDVIRKKLEGVKRQAKWCYSKLCAKLHFSEELEKNK